MRFSRKDVERSTNSGDVWETVMLQPMLKKCIWKRSVEESSWWEGEVKKDLNKKLSLSKSTTTTYSTRYATSSQNHPAYGTEDVSTLPSTASLSHSGHYIPTLTAMREVRSKESQDYIHSPNHRYISRLIPQHCHQTTDSTWNSRIIGGRNYSTCRLLDRVYLAV
jgi:hypothetical protein